MYRKSGTKYAIIFVITSVKKGISREKVKSASELRGLAPTPTYREPSLLLRRRWLVGMRLSRVHTSDGVGASELRSSSKA